MKKIALAGLAGMLLISASVNIISISGQAGKEYISVSVGFGTESTGLALSGSWIYSDDGGDIMGVGLGLNLPLRPSMATIDGKDVCTNLNYSDEGYVAAVGGSLQWKIGNSFHLFGGYYYFLDPLSNGTRSYEEANVDARYTIMCPVSIEAGYHYLNLSGKDGNRDDAVADGPCVGVNVSFWPLPAWHPAASFSFLLHLISFCVTMIR